MIGLPGKQEAGWKAVVTGVCLLLVSLTTHAADSWPRTFQNADGSTTLIPAKPQRILSTSVSVTGTLLAIDAPVVASVTAVNGQFFGQWAQVAQERKVAKAWPAGSVDPEQAWAIAPDLIVVSINGGDSARAQLAEFRAIAPTIVVNYGNQTWQSLAHQLAGGLGLERQSDARIAGFDALVADFRQRITPPPGLTNIISYHGPGTANPIATQTGVHARLLSALGFRIEAPDPAWHSNMARSDDFVWAEYENLTQLKGSTTFLLNAGDDRAENFLADPLLVGLPSVQKRQVWSLGPNSFRIDYYSALEIIRDIGRHFAVAKRQTLSAQEP